MTVPDDCLEIAHGKMILAVPKNIFSGRDAEIDEEKAKQFSEKTKRRYPWITDNAMVVVLRNARKEMLRLNDERTGGRSTSRKLESEGKTEMAIMHLKKHLEEHPDDADSWYALGELLCKSGKVEEGYRAINTGRSLI
jgi:cytochrome c-type biogenesis protein CcmH/NrfG